MSLHRTKATLIGLLEVGRVNEWIVTDKLGDALKAKEKTFKKPRFRLGERYKENKNTPFWEIRFIFIHLDSKFDLFQQTPFARARRWSLPLLLWMLRSFIREEWLLYLPIPPIIRLFHCRCWLRRYICPVRIVHVILFFRLQIFSDKSVYFCALLFEFKRVGQIIINFFLQWSIKLFSVDNSLCNNIHKGEGKCRV